MATVIVPVDSSIGAQIVLKAGTPSIANPLNKPIIIDAPNGFDAAILNPDGQLSPNP